MKTRTCLIFEKIEFWLLLLYLFCLIKQTIAFKYLWITDMLLLFKLYSASLSLLDIFLDGRSIKTEKMYNNLPAIPP